MPKKIKYAGDTVVVDYAINDSKGNEIDTTYQTVVDGESDITIGDNLTLSDDGTLDVNTDNIALKSYVTKLYRHTITVNSAYVAYFVSDSNTAITSADSLLNVNVIPTFNWGTVLKTGLSMFGIANVYFVVDSSTGTSIRTWHIVGYATSSSTVTDLTITSISDTVTEL